MATQDQDRGAHGVPHFLRPGALLEDRYRVEAILGTGAMGIVVRARHLELDQDFAIKFLRAELFDKPRVVSRFLQESQLAARIRSPHVARVIDAGAVDGGPPYLIMELLEGRDLARLIDEQAPIAIDVVLDLALQACEGLAAAHAAGVVHRDVKPGNLFICEAPSHDPVLKVLDFGISKLDVGPDGQQPARPAFPLGSPLYMSPEQMMGSGTIDARSDLWSLGVVLYELLTGTVPFTAGNLTELTHKILHLDPPRLRDARPDAPLLLEEILGRLLARRRADRYADAAELAAELGRLAGSTGEVSARRTARILYGVSAVEASEPPLLGISLHDLPTELAPPPVAARPRIRAQMFLVAAALLVVFSAGALALLANDLVTDADPLQARASLQIASARDPIAPRVAVAPERPEPAKAPASPPAIVRTRTAVPAEAPAPARTRPADPPLPPRLPQLPLAGEPVPDELLADSRPMIDDRL